MSSGKHIHDLDTCGECLPHLFESGQFKLHSGRFSDWHVNCDSITSEGWETIARVYSNRLGRFSSVEGVPTGGLPLAQAFSRHATYRPSEDPILIVDDVLSTGASMEEQRAGRANCIGFVAFARGNPPAWVDAMWYLDGVLKRTFVPIQDDVIPRLFDSGQPHCVHVQDGDWCVTHDCPSNMCPEPR